MQINSDLSNHVSINTMKVKVFILAVFCCANTFAQSKKVSDNAISAREFKSPSITWRSTPFLSLNDKLDTNILAKQIKMLADGGCGGVNLHARDGLLTEYLGEEWFQAIDASIRAAEKNGLKVWLYDEDKWPSGYGGGIVPRMNPEFVQQRLSRVNKSEPANAEDIVFSDEKYNYVISKAKMGNSSLNGTAYVDLLSKEVVNGFIKSTYIPYSTRYKNKIGSVVLGIFTDEPQIAPRPNDINSFSYTPTLFQKFKAMHGYELKPKLPLLFEDKEGFQKVRLNLVQTIAQLFELNYTKQLADFCEKNNMILQGHFMGEEKLSQVTRYSGNNMTMYRHMQMPGIDMLRLRLGTLNTPKSLSSVANQYDKKRRLCENFGVSGHNMSFEDRKWLMDWLTNTGVNFATPHLCLYSMKGLRKRDYPPSFFNEPSWKYNKIYEDYAARTSYVTSLGKYAAEIAVVHPLESGYIDLDLTNFNKPDVRNKKYDALLNVLQAEHRDYDLADEQIMSDIAKVQNGKLNIGKMNYRVMLLPAMLTIRQTTLNLLENFAKQGGKVFAIDELPTLVDGVASEQKLASLKHFTQLVDIKDIPDSITHTLSAPFTFVGTKSNKVWTHCRIVGNGYVIQLSNILRKEPINGVLSFSKPMKNVALWNLTNGKSYALKPNRDGNYPLYFAETQTWIVTTNDASNNANLKETYTFFSNEGKIIDEIKGDWIGKRVDPNAITLDFAQYSLDGGKTFSASEPVIGIHERLTNKLYNGKLILKYVVNADIVPKECNLIVEQPEMYTKIQVNNTNIPFTGNQSYIDHSFKKSNKNLPIIQGKNEIVLELNYVAPLVTNPNAIKRNGTEIEAIYVTGSFGVKANQSLHPITETLKNKEGTLLEKPINSFADFSIVAENEKVQGDLTHQGYPFYAGEYLLTNTFNIAKIDASKRYFIKLPFFEAIVVKLTLTGKQVEEPLVYHPYEIEVTKLIKEGNNVITLSLTNSLRNLLGPHHNKGGEMTGVGPESYTGRMSFFTSLENGEDNWYDVRLTKQPILWRDDYYMIPFGLLASPTIIER